VELSPYTKDRLNELQNGDQVELLSGHSVHWVAESEDGGFLICCEDAAGTERFVKTAHPPILATGFKSSLGLVKSLFEMDGKGHALLNQYDESTQTPGLFLSGPGVVHGELLFCFIYKFRQRFAVVAGAIAEGLGLSKAPLEEYRRAGLLLEDLSCCGEDCQC
ncbi:NAD(P)-binding domain-containing protein, partial [Paenibacillus sepulcri]|nr:NAD(P)-binding domain-containing protein [Paenibacillus sepulcri]